MTAKLRNKWLIHVYKISSVMNYRLMSVYCTIVDSILYIISFTDKPPCSSNPCDNGGICRNLNNFEYRCDCHETGYKGSHCETGIISISQPPVISLVGDTPSSYTISLSANPTGGELDIAVSTSDSSITVSPSTVKLSTTITTGSVTVTADAPGVYYLKFDVSGDVADSFETPYPMIVIVHDPYKETNHTMYQYFEHMSQSVGILVPGCCKQTIQDYYTPEQVYIEFNSSCAWIGQDSTQLATGVIFLSSSGSTVPLSITGSSLSVIEIGIPDHSLPLNPPQECSICSSTNLHCQYSVTVEDVMDFISCHALGKSFLNYTQSMLPAWLSLHISAPDSDVAYSFDPFDIHAEVLLGEQVVLVSGCENLQVYQDSLYAVYRFDDSLTVNIDGISHTYAPHDGDDPVCFAIDIGRGSSSQFQIGIPESYREEFTNLSPFQVRVVLIIHHCIDN